MQVWENKLSELSLQVHEISTLRG